MLHFLDSKHIVQNFLKGWFEQWQNWQYHGADVLLVWQICSFNWDLDIDSFVGSPCISFDGPVAWYLLVVQGGLSSNPGCYVYNFFIMTSLGA
jgi:hypothetical protein